MIYNLSFEYNNNIHKRAGYEKKFMIEKIIRWKAKRRY